MNYVTSKNVAYISDTLDSLSISQSDEYCQTLFVNNAFGVNPDFDSLTIR